MPNHGVLVRCAAEKDFLTKRFTIRNDCLKFFAHVNSESTTGRGCGGEEIRRVVKDDNTQAIGRVGENRCLSPRLMVHTYQIEY